MVIPNTNLQSCDDQRRVLAYNTQPKITALHRHHTALAVRHGLGLPELGTRRYRAQRLCDVSINHIVISPADHCVHSTVADLRGGGREAAVVDQPLAQLSSCLRGTCDDRGVVAVLWGVAAGGRCSNTPFVQSGDADTRVVLHNEEVRAIVAAVARVDERKAAHIRVRRHSARHK